MKCLLTEKDRLEKHHIWGLIINYTYENHGKRPEYVVVHPATYHKIIMCTNENNADFMYEVIQFNYHKEKPVTTIYGISFIRSEDIEEDFIVLC